MCTQSRTVIRARRDVYGSVERTSVYKRENMIDYKFSDFAVNSIYGNISITRRGIDLV